MERKSGTMVGVMVVGFLLLAELPYIVADYQGDALFALRRNLKDPANVLQSWDPTLVIRVDLGNAGLSGSLVPELGNLHSLQYLELSKNKLDGTIPQELGKLKNLVSLDLYYNNFTGEIPSSLGELKSLVFLRVNNNKLSGRIPNELTRLPNLKVVDFSSNNFCGTFPTSGSFARFSSKSFENNPSLNGPELLGAPYDSTCH
ncbi:hypothetical protein AXG93_1330s1020 [Marchantia polymorpha subsp. ruderalis]|uniref:Uncharacterized protein n=1 Tax=Marchantia polymorpha subsp. ruderalis TaxID=1480154 RepID=A0A176VUA2_MARPO|nr:hypothetical protein AXG93_1330s1020 [Marchantia polymorpha subsp. ruderalis]